MKKILTTLTMLMLVCVPAFALALPVQAEEVDADYLFGGGATTQDDLQDIVGLGSEDPRNIAAGVINAILGFLGIIAVVIILLGGFKWMTAGGNEDKVDEAKKLIKSGIIGLVIILAAWGIASFVISSLLSATTGDL